MRIFLLVAFLAIVVWLLLVRPTPEQLRRYMIRGGLIAVAALLILSWTGRGIVAQVESNAEDIRELKHEFRETVPPLRDAVIRLNERLPAPAKQGIYNPGNRTPYLNSGRTSPIQRERAESYGLGE